MRKRRVRAPSDYLSTRELADLLGVSVQYCKMGRIRGDGPPYLRLAANAIRYRRSDVEAWLRTRLHATTTEYKS